MGMRGADRVKWGGGTDCVARGGCPDTALEAEDGGLCDLAATDEVGVDVCCAGGVDRVSGGRARGAHLARTWWS